MNADQPRVLDQVLATARTVLDSPTLKASDNFFELGGDSLAVIEFCTQIDSVLGVECPLETVWDAEDFARLATCIEALRTDDPRRSVTPGQYGGVA